MKVGVVLKYLSPQEIGGGHSYYSQLISKISSYIFEKDIELIFIIFQEPIYITGQTCLNIKNIRKPVKYYILKNILLFFNIINFTKLNIYNRLLTFNNNILYRTHENIFKKSNIDILYYLTPEANNYNYPYIATIWDLGHKSTYSFPELSMNSGFESRDNFVKQNYHKAFAIFAESETGKNQLVFYERINPKRVYVLPMFEGPVVDIILEEEMQMRILQKYGITKNLYFYYPAQLWSHKNHINLLNAFKLFIQCHENFKLVLSGSNKGNLSAILSFIKKNNLTEKVVLTGFVPLEEVYTFYKNTASLVFPTFLGPTNMPLMEAKKLGVKVICSNLPGHIEQLKDYALYFEPNNYEDIFHKMLNILVYKLPEITIDKDETCRKLNDNLLEISKYRNSFMYNYDQV